MTLSRARIVALMGMLLLGACLNSVGQSVTLNFDTLPSSQSLAQNLSSASNSSSLPASQVSPDPSASVESACLRPGTYGFVLSGQIVPGGVGPVGTAQAIGTWQFDRDGKTMNGVDTVSYSDGSVAPRSYQGTFSSSINTLGACAGKIVLTDLGTPADPATASSAPALNFVVVNRGQELLLMQINPFRQESGSAKRLR